MARNKWRGRKNQKWIKKLTLQNRARNLTLAIKFARSSVNKGVTKGEAIRLAGSLYRIEFSGIEAGLIPHSACTHLTVHSFNCETSHDALLSGEPLPEARANDLT